MKMNVRPSKAIVATTEMYDIIYNDIMHLWSLLPKDDFWTARHFIDASMSYLRSIKDIKGNYEQRENTDSE